MATAAIDFGTVRTRLAVYDRHRRRSVVCVDMPTLAYVPALGAILVGQAAQEAIATDPAGAIDDLKQRLAGEEFLRNRRSCQPVELISQLFAEARRLALAQRGVGDLLTDCALTVPLEFDLRQGELLQGAARRAGCTSVSLIDEPVAVTRNWERHQAIAGNVLVVCDLGRTARVAVLRRPADQWRADLEIPGPPPVELREESLPRLLFDGLRGLGIELSKRGVPAPPLLAVGGAAQRPGVDGMLKDEGWPGEIWLPPDPAAAAVLGAIEVPDGVVPAEVLTCPECQFDALPKIAVSCPECGFPRRLFPDQIGAPRGSPNVMSARQAPSLFLSDSKTCPECENQVPRNTATCGNCGFPFHKQR